MSVIKSGGSFKHTSDRLVFLLTAITKPSPRSKIGLIVLAYIAFISLGMPDGLFGVAWPSIRETFALRLDSVGAFFFAGTTGYMLSSFLSGKIISRLGVGGTLAVSCALTASALLGYTLVPSWWWMVSLAVASGLGAGAIDAGINTYVASHFGEGLMQWLHASFGFGVTLGPIIMTAGLTTFDSWRWGYQLVGAAQLLLAASFLLTIRMWRDGEGLPADEQERRLTDYHTPFSETLRQPAVWLNLLMFFLYTGAELSFGSWTYSILTLSRNVPVEVAGLWAGSYWATFTVGRILAGLLTRRFGMPGLLKAGFFLALAGSLLLWWNPFPLASILAVSVIGFAIAPIFPGLVSGTSARVGKHHAANTIGMQIAAAGFGGAVVPSVAGVLAESISLEAIPVYLAGVFGVLSILYLVGSRPRRAAS
ncbi:MAG: MFS transporter [Chloroflexota bacterium]|nr:MFS transporter [Chloroflexota bacterium]